MGSGRARAAAFASLLLPVVLLAPGHAAALANDLQIPRLGNPFTEPAAVQRFRMLSDELGMSLAGTTLEPARTVGSDGFDIGLEVAMAFINSTTLINGQPYWSTTGSAASPDPTTVTTSSPLIIPAVHVRKGLPYSFEIGAKLMAITDSGMFAGQGEVKWGIIEGFRYLPDFSARVAVTQLFSQQDLNLTTGSADLTLGKDFGIVGLFVLEPYLGYAFTAIEGDSNAFVLEGQTEQQYLQKPLANQVRYAPTTENRLGLMDNFYDRFYGGLVLKTQIVSFNIEYDYSQPNAWSGTGWSIRPGLSTFAMRVAFTF